MSFPKVLSVLYTLERPLELVTAYSELSESDESTVASQQNIQREEVNLI